ncbi:MAG: hypothetical protein WBL05_03515 [Brooklawnia sp.]|uniref:hypothetical protein n=1 Tax=Brooklawnia sp. TaxID=2699740 RepID=UPI003C74428D
MASTPATSTASSIRSVSVRTDSPPTCTATASSRSSSEPARRERPTLVNESGLISTSWMSVGGSPPSVPIVTGRSAAAAVSIPTTPSNAC